MSMADEIKSRVKMPEVFDRYGLEPNRAGFIRCPFHQEKTASLSAFHNGERWKCFGCGAGGDVISFVMQFFGIGFSQALLRMDLDFGLGLSVRQPDLRESRRIAAERARRAAEEQRDKEYLDLLTLCHRRLWHAYLTRRPKSPEEKLDPQFDYALKNLDRVEWMIQEALEEMR